MGKIGGAVYQIDMNEAQLQYLGSEAQYNVFVQS